MAWMTWKRASSPDPTGEMDSLSILERFQDEVDRLLGWSRFPESSGLFDRSVYPSLDILETEEGCTIWADIPGLTKKDLELTVAANVLTLKGEKGGQSKRDKGRIYRDETWTGNFQRSISLPESVDTNKVDAEFRDGVLKISIAKKAEHKPRQIPVTVR